MSGAASLRVGWCPGALRPMQSGDGLIVRVKPRRCRLSLPQARLIGEGAWRYGNGALDLTRRGNLQLRGVTKAALPALTGMLDTLGLIDPSAEAEAVRNVVASPLAGLDASAAFDIGPAVAALEARLVEDRALHALPAKFGFVVDDGGRLGLGDVAADIRFLARKRQDGPGFEVVGDIGRPSVVWCLADRLADTAAAMARRFIEAREADPGLRHNADYGGARHEGVASSSRLFQVTGFTDGVLGIAAPFGRLDAGQWLALVAAASAECASDLRLTPWRAILIPGLSHPAADRIAAAATAVGLIADPADRRLGVAACAGAPGCWRGTTPVLADAEVFAARLAPQGPDRRIRLHVSGCSKGCAHRHEADLTLVGHDGVYDLVVRGEAGSEPVLRGLTVEQAAGRIEAAGRGEMRP